MSPTRDRRPRTLKTRVGPPRFAPSSPTVAGGDTQAADRHNSGPFKPGITTSLSTVDGPTLPLADRQRLFGVFRLDHVVTVCFQRDDREVSDLRHVLDYQHGLLPAQCRSACRLLRIRRRVAQRRTGLKLTAAQEKNWESLEKVLREVAATRIARKAEARQQASDMLDKMKLSRA